MLVMIGVLERARAIERFLDHPPPGVVLGTRFKLEQHFKVMAMKLQWAREVRRHAAQAPPAHHRRYASDPGAARDGRGGGPGIGRELEALGDPARDRLTLGLKGRLLERIRLKLVGPPRAASATETTVETEAPDA